MLEFCNHLKGRIDTLYHEMQEMFGDNDDDSDDCDDDGGSVPECVPLVAVGCEASCLLEVRGQRRRLLGATLSGDDSTGPQDSKTAGGRARAARDARIRARARRARPMSSDQNCPFFVIDLG